MSMFSFGNSILLGCMRTRCMMDNAIFGKKNRYILFNILRGIVSTKHANKSRKLIFFSLKKDSITLNTSDLSFKRYNHVMREKSSIKSKKYLKPLIEGIRLGPQISEWDNSKEELLHLLTRLGKVTHDAYLTHKTHPKKEIEDSTGIIDRIFCNEG